MKPRWNSNTLVLTILGVVLFLCGIDYGRKFYLDASRPNAGIEDASEPSFKKGDEAPEFELADKSGARHTLTSLANGKETMLWFLCGCNSCRGMQTYMSQLSKRLGPKAPQIISVSTQSPDFEERYKEITGLPQTLLYEKQGGEVMAAYRGHPCPRIYHLTPDRKVAWIGPSPNKLAKVSDMGPLLAQELGFAAEGEPANGKPEAPSIQALLKNDPISPGKGPGAAPGAQLPPGAVMGPGGPMPANVPGAPAAAKPPHTDDHAGHDHAGHNH